MFVLEVLESRFHLLVHVYNPSYSATWKAKIRMIEVEGQPGQIKEARDHLNQ
jgi:hypothetical protein